MGKSYQVGWLGTLTVISGLLQIIGWIMFAFSSNQYDSTSYSLASWFDQVGTILVFFTLLAIYLVHADSEGWFNKFSFFISILGASFFAGSKFVSTFVVPFVYQKAPDLLKGDPGYPLSLGFNLSFILFAIGFILFGILMIKAKKVPLLVPILFIVSPLIDFIPLGGFHFGQLLFSLGLLYFGYKLNKAPETASN